MKLPELSSRTIRLALVLLAVPNLVAGGWAIVAPRNWFDTFPGWVPHLVAAFPPFNQHLVTDAGSGLLAAGVVTLLALVKPRRDIVITSMVGALAFSVPHTLFHIASPSDLLTGGEHAVNVATLVIGTLLAVGVLTVAVMDRPAVGSGRVEQVGS